MARNVENAVVHYGWTIDRGNAVVYVVREDRRGSWAGMEVVLARPSTLAEAKAYAEQVAAGIDNGNPIKFDN